MHDTLGTNMGMCGEVMLTAFAHYAQEMEGMATDDDAYKTNVEAKEFFKTYCKDKFQKVTR
jgi:hypothetical protein